MSASISAVVTEYLDALDVRGVDVVRARLALLIAGELDDPETPRHSIPRLTSQLRGVISEIQSTKAKNGKTTADVRALLEVVR